jgi:hypothetical protein
VDFNTGKTINEIVVYGVRDDYTNTNNPSETTTSTLYGITSFDVQYWNGSTWQTVPNGSITNNNKVVVKLTFAAITTNRIRVVVNGAQDAYSRVVELEAWSDGNSASYSSLHRTALFGSEEPMLEKDTFSKAILNVLFPLWIYLAN